MLLLLIPISSSSPSADAADDLLRSITEAFTDTCQSGPCPGHQTLHITGCSAVLWHSYTTEHTPSDATGTPWSGGIHADQTLFHDSFLYTIQLGALEEPLLSGDSPRLHLACRGGEPCISYMKVPQRCQTGFSGSRSEVDLFVQESLESTSLTTLRELIRSCEDEPPLPAED